MASHRMKQLGYRPNEPWFGKWSLIFKTRKLQTADIQTQVYLRLHVYGQ